MALTQILKQRLLSEIENLSVQDLQEMLNFVRYLRFKQVIQEPSVSKVDLAPQNDPILSLIGIADVEPFAQEIDELLYSSV